MLAHDLLREIVKNIQEQIFGVLIGVNLFQCFRLVAWKSEVWHIVANKGGSHSNKAADRKACLCLVKNS